MHQYPPGGSPGMGGPPGMGPPPPPHGAPPGSVGRTDTLAILSLVTGLLGAAGGITGLLSMVLTCCCGALGAAGMLGTGIVSALLSGGGIALALSSRKRITRDPDLKGEGLATAGLVTSIISLVLALSVVVIGALATAGIIAVMASEA